MPFHSYTEVPEQEIIQTFKSVSWKSLLGVTVILAAITAYTAIPKGEPTNPIFIAIPGLVTVFFGTLFLGRLRQCMNPRNWLIKASDAGLYVNLQSNTAAPLAAGAPEVLFVPREAVACIRRLQESRTLPQRQGEYKTHYAYFDLVLHEPVPEALLVALARIRRNPGLRGGIGIRHDLHGAVRIQDRHTVRLVWDWIAPREDAAAPWFARHYTVEAKKKFGGLNWEKLSPEEREVYIDTLWEWGHVEDAIQLSALTRSTSTRTAANYLADRLG